MEYKRTNIYLTPEQLTKLEKLQERTGMSRAEITRRAIDHWTAAKLDPLEIAAEKHVSSSGEYDSELALELLVDRMRAIEESLTMLIRAQPKSILDRIYEQSEQSQFERGHDLVFGESEDE